MKAKPKVKYRDVLTRERCAEIIAVRVAIHQRHTMGIATVFPREYLSWLVDVKGIMLRNEYQGEIEKLFVIADTLPEKFLWANRLILS